MGLWANKGDENTLAEARGSAWDGHCRQSRDRQGAGYGQQSENRRFIMLILLIVLLLLLGGGGGYYGHSRWGYGGGAGIGIGSILLILLVVYLLGGVHY